MKLFYFISVIFLSMACYREEIYYSPEGKLKEVSHYFEKIQRRSHTYYFYNSNGAIAKEVLKDGDETGEILYKYNSAGRLIEKQNKIPGNQGFEYYEYDEKGRLTTVISTRSESYDLFYDNLDRLISRKYFSVRNSKTSKRYYKEQTFLYDSTKVEKITDEIIEERNFGSEEKILDRHLKYIYNADGLLEQKKLIDGKGFLSRSSKEFYTYDNLGRIFKKLTYNLNLLDESNYGLTITDTYYYFE